MEIMSTFKIYQYNYDNAKTSDYFFWQYIDDNGNKDWSHIELCCYQDNIESVVKMWNLASICETTYTDIDCEIQYDDIRNLIKKMESDI